MNSLTQDSCHAVAVDADAVDVAALLVRGGIEAHFQTIASVRRQQIIGLEALSRGVAENGELIAPLRLFEAAEKQNLAVELDRACRRKAVEAFAPLHRLHPKWILFLNFRAEALVQDLDGEHGIRQLAKEFGISAPNIAIEILETAFDDTQDLRAAIAAYRMNGFLVVLDDVGAGHSNLDRIALIKPDIIKSDGSLTRDIDKDYYSQEVYKSLATLSEKIGGWIITEGVETEDEALAALGMGGDILQGFYLDRPHLLNSDESAQPQARVQEIAHAFKAHFLQMLTTRNQARDQRRQILEILRAAVQKSARESFETQLRQKMCSAKPDALQSIVESITVLDAQGVQILPTLLSFFTQQKPKSVIFAAPESGADHSMKEYVYALQETEAETFETQPYVPLPAGDLCVTNSTFFVSDDHQKYILVVHFTV